MNINHIAIWANDIELLKEFYCRWFDAAPGDPYHNLKKHFSSYFLTFPDNDVCLEIMNVPEIIDRDPADRIKGFCHIAISLGSKDAVDEMTERMRCEGITVLDNPRITGDGCYESVVSDPEGNIIELTV